MTIIDDIQCTDCGGAKCYKECGFEPNDGIDLGLYRRIGVWSSVTGTSGISQEEVGIDANGDPIWGTFQEPNAPGNFPDTDPTYPNLPRYNGEPSEDTASNFPSSSAADGYLQMVDKYSGNFEYEKNVYELYLTLPPGCASGAESVRFAMERITGRGYAALYIAQSHDPADASFAWAYNRSNNNPIPFNYYDPNGAPSFTLSQTEENKFYIRIYAVDGSEQSATNGHFNAAAFNPIPLFQYDGGAYNRFTLDMYGPSQDSVNGFASGINWTVCGGNATSSDGQKITEEEFESLGLNVSEVCCESMFMEEVNKETPKTVAIDCYQSVTVGAQISSSDVYPTGEFAEYGLFNSGETQTFTLTNPDAVPYDVVQVTLEEEDDAMSSGQFVILRASLNGITAPDLTFNHGGPDLVFTFPSTVTINSGESVDLVIELVSTGGGFIEGSNSFAFIDNDSTPHPWVTSGAPNGLSMVLNEGVSEKYSVVTCSDGSQSVYKDGVLVDIDISTLSQCVEAEEEEEEEDTCCVFDGENPIVDYAPLGIPLPLEGDLGSIVIPDANIVINNLPLNEPEILPLQFISKEGKVVDVEMKITNVQGGNHSLTQNAINGGFNHFNGGRYRLEFTSKTFDRFGNALPFSIAFRAASFQGGTEQWWADGTNPTIAALGLTPVDTFLNANGTVGTYPATGIFSTGGNDQASRIIGYENKTSVIAEWRSQSNVGSSINPYLYEGPDIIDLTHCQLISENIDRINESNGRINELEDCNTLINRVIVDTTQPTAGADGVYIPVAAPTLTQTGDLQAIQDWIDGNITYSETTTLQTNLTVPDQNVVAQTDAGWIEFYAKITQPTTLSWLFTGEGYARIEVDYCECGDYVMVDEHYKAIGAANVPVSVTLESGVHKVRVTQVDPGGTASVRSYTGDTFDFFAPSTGSITAECRDLYLDCDGNYTELDGSDVVGDIIAPCDWKCSFGSKVCASDIIGNLGEPDTDTFGQVLENQTGFTFQTTNGADIDPSDEFIQFPDGTTWGHPTCPGPMTRAQAIALRNAGELDPQCHYIITNPDANGTLDAELILLHALDGSTFSNCYIKTSHDNLAWRGIYDIDLDDVLEVYDNLENHIKQNASVTTFPYGVATINDNYVDGGSVVYTAGTLTDSTITSGGRINLVDGTIIACEVTQNSTLNMNGGILRESNIVNDSDVTFNEGDNYENEFDTGTVFIQTGNGLVRYCKFGATTTWNNGDVDLTNVRTFATSASTVGSSGRIVTSSFDNAILTTAANIADLQIVQSSFSSYAQIAANNAARLYLYRCELHSGGRVLVSTGSRIDASYAHIANFGYLQSSADGGFLRANYCRVDNGYIRNTTGNSNIAERSSVGENSSIRFDGNANNCRVYYSKSTSGSALYHTGDSSGSYIYYSSANDNSSLYTNNAVNARIYYNTVDARGIMYSTNNSATHYIYQTHVSGRGQLNTLNNTGPFRVYGCEINSTAILRVQNTAVDGRIYYSRFSAYFYAFMTFTTAGARSGFWGDGRLTRTVTDPVKLYSQTNNYVTNLS